MKIYAKLFCSLLMLFLLGLAGCASKPAVTDFWIDETLDGRKFERILVIGAAEKITFRNLFEGELVNQLKSRGIDAVPSYEVLPYNNMLTREAVLSAVEKYEIDSVLITSLVERSKKTVFYSTNAGGNPYVYYNNIYSSMRSPGNTASYDIEILFLKTNLYDVQSEKLVWSMTSESEYKYNIKSINSAIELVINKLQKDSII